MPTSKSPRTIKFNMPALAIVFTVFSMVLLLGASAFTKPVKAEEKPLLEYVFVLNSNADPNVASNYVYSATGTSCDLGTEICAVSNTQNSELTQAELNAILSGQDSNGKVYRKD